MLIDLSNSTNMSFYSRGPVLARLHAAFEKTLHLRCIEIEKILLEHSYKDLAGCLPLIVENIFGFGGSDTSVGNWHIGRITQSQCSDFSKLRYLLGPDGPLLQVIYQLSTDTTCRYEFPICCLPYPTRSLIDAGTIPPFYQDKVQVSPAGKPLDSVFLGAFEYYMFHFAYYIVNVQGSKSSRMSTWNKPDDCLYPVMLEDYLKYFFPLDCSSPSTVPYARSSPISTSPAIPHSSPPRQSNTLQSPSGYATMLSLFHEAHAPLATSSPVGKVAATNADLGCTVDETWRSEVLLQIIVDFHLNQYARVDCDSSLLASYTTSMLSQTGNHMRMVRLLVKHLHYFVNSAPARRVAQQRPQVTQQWDDFKRRVWPHFVQKQLYNFLCHNFEWWPLDAMFRLVLETWLSYIQPWRYCIDQRPSNVEGLVDHDHNDANRGLARDGSLDEKWRPFIVDNLLFYTVLSRSFLLRAVRMDLSASKNAFMLFRMSKVFTLPNLVEMLRDAENAVPDTSFNERVGTVSGARRPVSPTDYNNCRYFGNMTSSLMAQITELEGPRYEYRQLFNQAATERMIRQLLELMETASKNAALAAQLANESSNVSWMESIFGSNVDFNTSRYYYYNDEGMDTGAGVRATEAYLEQAAANLCCIFQIDRLPVLAPPTNGQKFVGRDRHIEPPDVDVDLNGSLTLSDRGRKQLMNGLRRFEIEYVGNPDLQPIRSYECAFLVRLLFAVACYINTRFAEQINHAYYREDFVGRMVRHILQPPSIGKSPLTPQRMNCMSPSTRERIMATRAVPYLSLRRLATYRTVAQMLLLYIVLYLWRNFGLVEYSFVVLSIMFIYFVLKTLFSNPIPLDMNSPR